MKAHHSKGVVVVVVFHFPVTQRKYPTESTTEWCAYTFGVPNSSGNLSTTSEPLFLLGRNGTTGLDGPCGSL
jgi:hypothetical protein